MNMAFAGEIVNSFLSKDVDMNGASNTIKSELKISELTSQ